MQITNEMFHRWKKDPVTEKMMAALDSFKRELEEAMANPDLIVDKDCRGKLLRLLGRIEGVNLLLDIDIDQLVENNKDEDNPNWT